ncbi:MAG TPA: MarR family transcriptional regulator [Blastococcus sp.]|nr:MarR family transcriptional regulator [Blastococcus sp.]
MQPSSPLVDDLAELIVALGSLAAPRRGLSRTAAATLTRLQRSGPTRLTELATAEGVTQPSMSTLVARLVDQGLVVRGGDPQDARVVVLNLTPAGEDLLAQRRADRAERLTRALAGLPPEDTARITDAVPALTRLADALRRSPTSPEVTR